MNRKLLMMLPLLCVPVAVGGDVLPNDPLQRCAIKALRGDYGRLKTWQRRGYEKALKRRITVQGLAWVTSYYPQEGFHAGDVTRSGVGVSQRSAACIEARWKKWQGRFVWTAAYGLRIIEDMGANSNEVVARKKGARIWFDYWFPRPYRQNPVTKFAVF